MRVNSVAPSIAALNSLPIKQVGATTVYLSDVAHVRDGWAVQQNIVHAEGKRSVLLTIIKNGDASTLDVVNRVKAALPAVQKAAPPGMQIHLLFDQSVFVEQAIGSVLREGAIAAGLTALMILLFLGSWRSTLVVMVSIPLSILTSIAVLSALGETINIMTLGGLASLSESRWTTRPSPSRTPTGCWRKRPFDTAVEEVPAADPDPDARHPPRVCLGSSCRARRAICLRH